MPSDTNGRLIILGERGGTIAEVTSFLADLEQAYLALYRLDGLSLELRRLRRRWPLELFLGMGYPASPHSFGGGALDANQVPPRDRLFLHRVRIESPGFWEFLGALNPLQQIREYLNDRHKRRQDKEFREAAEKEKLQLENELIRRQIYEKENAIFRERVELLRDMGYDNDEIDGLIWGSVGAPLAKLGKHQDTGLIGSGDVDGKGKQ